MGLAGKLRELRVRASGDQSRRLPDAFYEHVASCRRGLEIGGPSALFGERGVLPVYPTLKSVDCVQWAATSFWHEVDPHTGFVPDGQRTGRLHILDDVDLAALPSNCYDLVLSSHVIEHIANPLRALAAWRRVTVSDGYVLTVAPHLAATFDRRRPITPLEHMIDDYDRTVGEDDLTHLDETLRLHDRRRDILPFDTHQLAAKFRDNANTRFLHHHTFTTLSLGALLRRAGLEIVAAEARLPHDIYVLARWPSDRGADNSAHVLADAAGRSPFRADRRAARSGQRLAIG
jgi:SAM-dependent methyltransferase